MKTFLLIVILILAGALAVFYFLKQRAERMLAGAKADADAAWKQRAADVSAAQAAAQTAKLNAEAALEKKSAEVIAYAGQIRDHYERAARTAVEKAEGQLNQTLAELEPLRRYASLHDAEG